MFSVWSHKDTVSCIPVTPIGMPGSLSTQISLGTYNYTVYTQESLKDYEERSNYLLDLAMEEGFLNSDEPDFTREELDQAINNLKNNSPGPDLIHAKVLKHSGSGFRKAYLKFVNKVKNSKDSIPEQLDNVLINALHKKGSKKHLVNKRGIFLTSVLSKVIEKMIKERVKF